MAHQISHIFVVKKILSLSGNNLHFGIAYHIVELIRINAGGVHYHLRLVPAVPCADKISLLFSFNGFHFLAEAKFNAVYRRVFRQRYGQPERTHYPARGRVKRSHRVVPHVRLQRKKFFPV